jgi:hypothetical protein
VPLGDGSGEWPFRRGDSLFNGEAASDWERDGVDEGLSESKSSD